MPEELDPNLAETLVSGAMNWLTLTPGNKILCTKRQLRECLVELARRRMRRDFSEARRNNSIQSFPRVLPSVPRGWTSGWRIWKRWTSVVSGCGR